MRGTFDAYNKLTTKNDDTLYFIYNEDSNESALYLGSRKIASAEGDSISASSIDALADVLISEGLTDKSLLVYDATQSQWVNKDFASLIFVGATATSNGVAGFVPAPEMNQTDLFLRSDGTWAKIPGGTATEISQNILNITNESNKAHTDIIAEAVVNLTIAKGDIIIIKDLISTGIYEHTAYIYDGENWVVLNDSYNAENVIFAEDIAEIPAAGENLKTVLASIVSELTLGADNASIELENKTFSLKNYGKQYYKYIPESGSEETGDLVAAHYELQIVDAGHPWIAGLEPRVTSEEGQLLLAWFEQNPTTIDGVNAQVSAIQTTVNDLQQATETLSAAVASKANAADVYTKEEVNEKIAAADHLKRKIVANYEAIQTYIDENEDADQYIFMVPIGVTDYDNKYDEYIVIDGIIEPVGNWSVDLSDYATKDEVNTALATKVTAVEGSRLMTEAEGLKLERIEGGAQVNFINSVDEAALKVENKKLSLLDIPVSKVTNLQNLLNNKVDKVEGSRLITEAEAIKLASAEANFISSVDTNYFSVTDRHLSLLDISISKVTNLENLLNAKADKTEVNAMNTSIADLSDRVSTVEEAIKWVDLT